MEIKDFAKQLANRVNQAHYIEDVLLKVAKGAYKKGITDGVNKTSLYGTPASEQDVETIKDAMRRYLSRVSTEKGNEPYVCTTGKSYTAKELQQEIENETDFGKQFCRDLILLTIEMLFKGKEKLPTKTWVNPLLNGFPPIGTVCAIKKHNETMIGRLVSTDEWDEWEVNGEYEDCVEFYYILPI